MASSKTRNWRKQECVTCLVPCHSLWNSFFSTLPEEKSQTSSVRPFFLRFAEFSTHAKRWSRSAESPNKKVFQSPSRSCWLKCMYFGLEFHSWYFHRFDREGFHKILSNNLSNFPEKIPFLFDVVANVLEEICKRDTPCDMCFLNLYIQKQHISTQRKLKTPPLHPRFFSWATNGTQTLLLQQGILLLPSMFCNSSLPGPPKKCQWRRLINL